MTLKDTTIVTLKDATIVTLKDLTIVNFNSFCSMDAKHQIPIFAIDAFQPHLKNLDALFRNVLTLFVALPPFATHPDTSTNVKSCILRMRKASYRDSSRNAKKPLTPIVT